MGLHLVEAEVVSTIIADWEFEVVHLELKLVTLLGEVSSLDVESLHLPLLLHYWILALMITTYCKKRWVNHPQVVLLCR